MSAVTVSGRGFTPPAGEDQHAVIVPGRPSGEAFFALLAAMLSQDRDCLTVKGAERRAPAARVR
jgi:hypothetical protein